MDPRQLLRFGQSLKKDIEFAHDSTWDFGVKGVFCLKALPQPSQSDTISFARIATGLASMAPHRLVLVLAAEVIGPPSGRGPTVKRFAA